jgi:hypothetical protein
MAMTDTANCLQIEVGMEDHNYTIKLFPYGTQAGRGIVEVSPSTLFGYWEIKDGTEGGGLWFDRVETRGSVTLELIDFDGNYQLPGKVVEALRDAGFIVSEDFDSSEDSD